MIQISDMDKFRNMEYAENKQIVVAFYVFFYKLMPCVNLDWEKEMKDNKLKNFTSIHQYCTVSDEAFVRWVIFCKYNKAKSMAEAEISNVSGKKLKGKEQGKHDSTQFLDVYVKYYMDVKASRKDKNTRIHWNNIFWTLMKLKQKKILDVSNHTQGNHDEEITNHVEAIELVTYDEKNDDYETKNSFEHLDCIAHLEEI